MTAVVIVLAGAAIPYARWTVRRSKEAELRRNLKVLRDAIDRYHKDSVSGYIDTSEAGVETVLSGPPPARHFPARLQVLVDGVPIAGEGALPGEERRTQTYLRAIPPDPFAPEGDECDEGGWRLRSYQDEPDSASWGGENVYDVRACSDLLSLDGVTKYDQW